ncbi:2'-5' RNA ligase, partial [Mesorhizobium sp. M7A.F.Ca.CA.002.03.2.1]
MYLQGEFDYGLPEPPWRPKRPERVFFGLFLQSKD